MPNINYQYLSLANIAWPAPGAAVAGGVTTCAGAPANILPALGTPIGAAWPVIDLAALLIGVYPGPALIDLTEMQWRLATLRAAAQTTLAGGLGSTPLIGAVDPSEQATLSYHMGSVLTALMGIIVVPALNFMHLRRYIAIGGVVNFVTPQRPDFISFGGANIQIWEAKGRVGGAVTLPLRAGFTQTLAVNTVTILGVPIVPASRICCLARRSMAGTWDIHVTDPTVQIPTVGDANFRGKLYAEYYRPFNEVLNLSTSTQAANFANQTFATAPIQGADVTIGIDQRIAKALNDYLRSTISAADLTGIVEPILTTGYTFTQDSTRYVNANGLYITVGDSWTSH